ncbi:MAG: response regulator [Candidatus Magnetoovum sp. WYHC-5]|nr:response regulator [Candidatus Magnetoovum sp. WYHC-5]
MKEKGNILIIDDYTENLKLLSDILYERGYKVRPSRSGLMALKSVEAEPPDLIILDIKMPVMDGYEVCCKLKQNDTTRGIPVIFISALNEMSDKIKGFEVGGVDYIIKPFQAKEVLARVETHLMLYKYQTQLEHLVEERTLELKRETIVNLKVAELSKFLLEADSIDKIAQLTLEYVKELTDSKYGYVGYIEPASGHLIGLSMTKDIWDSCKVDNKSIMFKQYRGLWGWVLNNKVPLFTNAPLDDKRSVGLPKGHAAIERFLSVPAMIGDKLVGQISLANSTHDYTQQDVTVVLRLATIYAIAIKNMWTKEELRKLNLTLNDRVYEEIEKRKKQEYILIQQSKLAAMGDMLSNIAHQWRQPLNVIGVLLINIQDAYDYGELNKNCLSEMVNTSMAQIKYMSKTIDDFTNFFKPDKTINYFDVKVVTAEAIALVSNRLQQHNILYKLICHTHNMICDDVHNITSCNDVLNSNYINEFRQTMLSLINNAVDAILERQQKQIIEHGFIMFDFYSNSETIIINIADNGGGIPYNIMDRIFEPYFTTKFKAQGTGVGLYMSKLMIENSMGGKIYAENTKNGATITIELPVVIPK